MTQLNFVYGAAPSYAKIKDTVTVHSEKKKKKKHGCHNSSSDVLYKREWNIFYPTWSLSQIWPIIRWP